MHEGGHGILDGVKKKHHDHDHNHDHDRDHVSSFTTKISASIITAAIIVAFILWKWFLPSN
ncbi:MAG: hypothetical protein VX677_14900 [Candidatus Poribacteria bacterium]|nr:hypothetical protein [Candidatus Poribacteria bacterium]